VQKAREQASRRNRAAHRRPGLASFARVKIATWNVNSIRARLDKLLAWLPEHQPDVLCLQEIKVEASGFPIGALAALGYEAVVSGQRSYNGVAMLSKVRLQDVRASRDDGHGDAQARLIGGSLGGVRIVCVYMPNGSAVPSDKYEYKLKWMARFREHLAKHYQRDQKLLVCGDFNVAPEPVDVYDPVGWVNEPIFHIEARNALHRIAEFGLVDVVRKHNPGPGLYSYWDYRLNAFTKGEGLRIDHIFCTPVLAERCTAACVDRASRKGNAPSDHAALIADFDL
jgi:exodeoxyribonuclease III